MQTFVRKSKDGMEIFQRNGIGSSRIRAPSLASKLAIFEEDPPQVTFRHSRANIYSISR